MSRGKLRVALGDIEAHAIDAQGAGTNDYQQGVQAIRDRAAMLRELVRLATDEQLEAAAAVVAVKTRDVILFWRGSATDLVTDIAAELTVSELAELAGELVLAWRTKRIREGG